MGQEQPTPDNNEGPDLERTQPSPSQPPRRLDWRPSAYQAGTDEAEEEAPPVRRVPRPSPRRRRPPTEGAPAWLVGLGVGALLAVIILLVVAFVFSRRSPEPEPTPTVVIVTPTATLAPRPTATVPALADTPETEATEEAPSTAPPAGTSGVGG
jgi:cytoskeletal protein RodZ